MLHEYPADVPYLRFHELEDLKTRAPADAEEAMDRLRRLLPLPDAALSPGDSCPMCHQLHIIRDSA